MKRMTRALTICAIAASAAMPSGSHAATTVMQSRNYFLSWNAGPNSVFIMASAYVNVVTGNVVAANAFVGMGTMLGNHSGQAQAQNFTLDLDPLALTGKMSGTAQGQSGTIAFSLDFLGTNVTTIVPKISGAIVPSVPPRAVVQSLVPREGYSSGTVTSSLVGAVTVTNGPTSAQSYTVIDAQV